MCLMVFSLNPSVCPETDDVISPLKYLSTSSLLIGVSQGGGCCSGSGSSSPVTWVAAPRRFLRFALAPAPWFFRALPLIHRTRTAQSQCAVLWRRRVSLLCCAQSRVGGLAISPQLTDTRATPKFHKYAPTANDWHCVTENRTDD